MPLLVPPLFHTIDSAASAASAAAQRVLTLAADYAEIDKKFSRKRRWFPATVYCNHTLALCSLIRQLSAVYFYSQPR